MCGPHLMFRYKQWLSVQLQSNHYKNKNPSWTESLKLAIWELSGRTHNGDYILLTLCQTKSEQRPAEKWARLTRMMGQIELGGRMWSFRGPQSHSGFIWEAHLLWSWRRWWCVINNQTCVRYMTGVCCLGFICITWDCFIFYLHATTNKSFLGVNWYNDLWGIKGAKTKP